MLKQEDLDRAMSLCTSLKGHLKSKFLVLSDDRILPPYQPKGGKRSHPDNVSQDSIPVKRTHQDLLRRNPGVQQSVPASFGPPSSSAPVASGVQQSAPPGAVMTSSVPVAYGHQQTVQVTSAPSTNLVSTNFAGVSGVQPITVFPTLSSSGATFTQLPSFLPGAMSVPPPQLVQPGVVPVQSGQSVRVSQSPAYTVVPSRKGKGKSSANVKNQGKAAAGTSTVPGRLTPSRAAKDKKSRSQQVTSPGPDQYASCEESGEDQGESMEEVQATPEVQE